MPVTQAGKTPQKKGSRPLSVIIGTLLIPVSALAAYAFVSPTPGSADQSEVPSPEAIAGSVLVLDSGVATAQDLEQACGPAGLELVDTETSGSITDVQQAALDALREICSQQGMAIPGPAAPDPIVQQVIITTSAGTPPPTTTDDDHHENEQDHDEDDDDHDEDDHEDEDDHDEDQDDDDDDDSGDDD